MRRLLALAVVAVLATAVGCRSTGGGRVGAEAAAAAAAALVGDPAAGFAGLYRVRGRGVGGLRLTLLANGEQGRMTISEAMGAAVSIAAWSPSGAGTLIDMRRRCRLEGGELSLLLGLGALPLAEAARLLAGRLPALAEDEVEILADGRLLIRSDGWEGTATLAADPWRVVRLKGRSARGHRRFRLVFSAHDGTLPTRVRIDRTDGHRIELEAIRLEPDARPELPPLPGLPRCGAESEALGPEGG